jgi:hypothetical protein
MFSYREIEIEALWADMQMYVQNHFPQYISIASSSLRFIT